MKNEWLQLSKQEQEFCFRCNGVKHGAEPHTYEPNGNWSEDKDDYVCVNLWKKPEKLGFIECIGSYKWIKTDKFNSLFSIESLNRLESENKRLREALRKQIASPDAFYTDENKTVTEESIELLNELEGGKDE